MRHQQPRRQARLKTSASSCLLLALVLLETSASLASQQQAGNSTSTSATSLAITERASNSRHVSGSLAASGTTAVATASVLASNNPNSQSGAGAAAAASPPPYASPANGLDSPNRPISHHHQQQAHLQHQQHHQFQQQNQQQHQQHQIQNQQQQQQYNNGQQLASVPLVSSTFVFNPLTGQYGGSSADFGAANAPLGQQQFAQTTLGQHLNQNHLVQYQQQQQQPYRNQIPYFVAASGYQQPNFITTSQQRYNQQLNRRNGANLAAGVNGNYLGAGGGGGGGFGLLAGGQVAPQLDLLGSDLADAGSGLYPGGQQQQQLELGNSLAASNSYQIGAQANQQQQQQHQISVQQQQFGAEPADALAAGGRYVQQASYEQCVAADNRLGTCYQAGECIRRGGTPMGKCGPADAQSGAVCCLFDVTCGQFAAERYVYFRNPGYPGGFEGTRMCQARIGKLDKAVCQMRFDLLRFDVAKPTNGNCSQDMFVVSGQNENYVIPKICGFNDGQHYYVGVDESGVITLHMMMLGQFYRRNFEILISQIACRSDAAAPAHCLQYYTGTHGTIKSFNYEDEQQLGYDLAHESSAPIGAVTVPFGQHLLHHQQHHQQHQQQLQRNQLQQPFLSAAQFGLTSRYQHQQQPLGLGHFAGYPNDLDYTMCIKKESGFCSITYQLSRGELGLQPFGVGGWLGGHQSGLNSSDSAGVNLELAGWHQQATNECRDDYLLVGGTKLCSGPAGAGGGGGGHNGANLGLQLGQLLQQYARNQQQLAQAGANVSLTGNGQQPQQQQQQQVQNGNNNAAISGANLEQQQAALEQQIALVQQQQLGVSSQHQANRYQQFDPSQLGDSSQLQHASVITDTTSGPFNLRFVSNVARNGRGFHIDYRQNPCK